jgi:hypothetical protein
MATALGKDLELWHRRFRHLGFDNLKKLMSRVDGIDLKSTACPSPCSVSPLSRSLRTQSKEFYNQLALELLLRIVLKIAGAVTPSLMNLRGLASTTIRIKLRLDRRGITNARGGS